MWSPTERRPSAVRHNAYMAAPPRAPLTRADIGCWVIKSATAPQGVVSGWLPGERRELSRCLRPTYRLGLMAPGQRCLLWCSGSRDPGVHAIGRLSAAAVLEPSPCVLVELWLLASPVSRAEILHAPSLAGAEVLRMPAGSNPSYLSPPQIERLVGHLDDASLRLATWT